MTFVLDSSVALTWLLPDEESDAVDALADKLSEAPAVAPSLWYREVGNALLMAVRRKRLSRPDMDRLLAAAIRLPLETDAASASETLPAIVALAYRHELSVYDATYLELAIRRSLPLASLDDRLRAASRKLGIACLP
jgi:predicted nucleic acid-binding protein